MKLEVKRLEVKMYYHVPFYDNISPTSRNSSMLYILKLHRGQKVSTENILLSLSHSCTHGGVYKIAHMPTLLKHYSSTVQSITISHAVSERTVRFLFFLLRVGSAPLCSGPDSRKAA